MRPNDPIDKLSDKEAKDILKSIRDILWDEKEPYLAWESDHIQMVSQQFIGLRFPTVNCICGRQVHMHIAHLHQGQFVGECCWDERLRSTE